MIPTKLPQTKVQKLFIDIDNFKGGSYTDTPDATADTKFALDATNLEQYADGVYRTRPGTNYYGAQIASLTSIDGSCEFTTSGGTRVLLVVGGGKLYKSTNNGSTWSEVSGATFTAGHRCYFLHARDKIYISNRNNALATFDGTTLAAYTGIADPSAPTATRGAGLSSGSYNNYYRIQAVNRLGFTNPSDADNETSNKHRDDWSAANEYIGLTWTPVSDATGYQIFWGNESGYENLIAEVPSTVSSFNDKGQSDYPYNEYIETADDNTTSGPKFGPMELSSNRMWGTYDPDNEYRVYASGVGANFGSFSPFYGGAYIDLEKGGRYKPVSVIHYRTGKGDPIVTALCNSPDGQGTTFQVELTSAQIGETSFTVPVSYKIVGAIGSDAPLSVVKAGNSIMFANKKGAYFLRNQSQLYQILSSDDATKLIRNKWETINPDNVSKICAYYNPPKVYFSVPMSATSYKTAVYDMELNNWVWAWDVGFKQFLEYTDTNGRTHFLGVPVSGGRLVEISKNYLGDFGAGFHQQYLSPLIYVSKDKTDKGKPKYAIFTLGNFQGSVTCTVLGLSESGITSALASETATSTIGGSGWSDEAFSDLLFSDTADTPTTFTLNSQNITVRVNKKLKAIQFKVTSTTRSYWELLRVQAKGVIIPGRPIYN